MRDDYQEQLMLKTLDYGTKALEKFHSKTFLNFYDPYFSIPMMALASPTDPDLNYTFEIDSPN